METVAVFSDVGYRARIYDSQGDGAVHYALFNLLVVCLVKCHAIVPLVKIWSAVTEVAVQLTMSGCADLIDLSNDIAVALVGNECLRIRCC